MNAKKFLRILLLSALTLPFVPAARAMTLEHLNQSLVQLYQTAYKNSNASGTLFGYSTLADDADYFAYALKSYCVLRESDQASKITNLNFFTIINLDINPQLKRLLIYDIQNKKFAYHTWTTHASGSAVNFDVRLGNILGTLGESIVHYRSLVPEFFSNEPKSEETSVGMSIAESKVYDSQKVYAGLRLGHSLHLNGVDGKLNSNNSPRGILVHRWEFDPWNTPGQALPTSLGCFMVPMNQIEDIIHLMAGGAVMVDQERIYSDYNEDRYKAQLKSITDLKNEFEIAVKKLSQKYPFIKASVWAARKVELNQNLAKLREKIEATHNYFKAGSKYIGFDPQNPDACASALGIN